MIKYRVYLENYWEAQLDEFDVVDYTSHFTEEKPCNIYMVGIRPRVLIKPDSFKVVNVNTVELEFIVQEDVDSVRKMKVEVKLPRAIKGEASLTSNKPHSRFQINDDNGPIFLDKQMVRDSGIEAKAFYVLRANLSDPDDIAYINDMEVLYIGQSLKMDKKISAVKRLQNHKKLQRILQRCNTEYIYSEVYVLLCSFVQKVDFIAGSDALIKAGAETALNQVFADLQYLKDDKAFRTTVAEAALIDYFDTKEFNKDFIGSFGRKTHSYYSNLVQKRVSEVTLEVDVSKLCYIFSDEIERSCYHSVSYDPHDEFKKTVAPYDGLPADRTSQ